MLSYMEIPEIFKFPEPPKSKRKTVSMICDCGCGETIQKYPCIANRTGLHFKNRQHHGVWLSKNHGFGTKKQVQTCTALTVVPEKVENG